MLIIIIMQLESTFAHKIFIDMLCFRITVEWLTPEQEGPAGAGAGEPCEDVHSPAHSADRSRACQNVTYFVLLALEILFVITIL